MPTSKCPNCNEEVVSVDRSEEDLDAVGTYEDGDGNVLAIDTYSIQRVILEPCECEFPQLTERHNFS